MNCFFLLLPREKEKPDTRDNFIFPLTISNKPSYANYNFCLLITVFIDCRTFKIFALRLALSSESSAVNKRDLILILFRACYINFYIIYNLLHKLLIRFPITSD